VRYCSDACRAHKLGVQDRALEQKMLDILPRGAGKTICPSKPTRAIADSGQRAAWQPLLEPARAAARQLVAAGGIVIRQRSRVVDPSRAKSPIRLRKA
jgi:hypothetical protein